MIINFRHGIVSAPVHPQTNVPTFLSSRVTTVDLVVSTTPVVLTIAHGTSNYLFSLEASVNSAWTGFGTAAYPSGLDYYLFIELHPTTGVVSYGQTKYNLISSPSAPQNPQPDQHWYDTLNFKLKVWTGTIWVEKIRLFLAKYVGSSTFEYKPFGTQIGISSTETSVGKIVYDGFGKPVKKSNGEFFTTEDYIFVNGVVSAPNSLETRIISVVANQSIPANSVVKFVDFGIVELARYEDTDNKQLAFATQSASVGQSLDVVLQGYVQNTQWGFSAVNAHVWIGDNGIVTTTNPAIANVARGNQPPIGRVISPTSFRFVPPTVSLQVVGRLSAENGGTGASSPQEALNLFAASVTEGSYLRGDGTNVVMSRIFVDDLPDQLTQNTTGSSGSLATPRTISMTGDVSYTTEPFDGTQDITGVGTLATILTPGTYTQVRFDEKGRAVEPLFPTTLFEYGITDAQPLNARLTNLTTLTGSGLLVQTADSALEIRQVAVAGTGLSIDHSSGVTGNPTITLNSSTAGVPNSVVLRDANGNFNAGIVTANIEGNSTSASKLETSRQISMVGDVEWSVEFDGTSASTAAATLATVNGTVGTFGSATAIPIVTVNAKGLVTGVDTIPVNSGQLTISTTGKGLTGSGTFTANSSSPTTVTVASNATELATPSTIVFRDQDGNFSANSITAESITVSNSAAVFGTTSFSIVTPLTTTWTNFTNVAGLALGTGTYVLQLSCSGELYSATMSWYDGTCTSNETEEIQLNRAGPGGGAAVFARIRRSVGAPAQLQLSSSQPIPTSTITAILRKLI